MQELSLNILDIAQNSVKAKATLVEILLAEGNDKTLALCIRDNGKGMSPEMLQNVTDPFCTSRTTRKVGLGLPFLKMAAQQTGGDLHIKSELGVGTSVHATFALGHIDLAPLGDIAGTVSALVQCNPHMDFVYSYQKGEQSFDFDTRQVREMLGGDVPLSEPAVALFVRDYVWEHMQALQNDDAGQNAI